MSKFAPLAIFLLVCIGWLYQPFPIDHNDALIDKYRPSLIHKDTTTTNPVRRIKTNFDNHATAYHFPKVELHVY